MQPILRSWFIAVNKIPVLWCTAIQFKCSRILSFPYTETIVLLTSLLMEKQQVKIEKYPFNFVGLSVYYSRQVLRSKNNKKVDIHRCPGV